MNVKFSNLIVLSREYKKTKSVYQKKCIKKVFWSYFFNAILFRKKKFSIKFNERRFFREKGNIIELHKTMYVDESYLEMLLRRIGVNIYDEFITPNYSIYTLAA